MSWNKEQLEAGYNPVNKEVLSKFGEINGLPTYDGVTIGETSSDLSRFSYPKLIVYGTVKFSVNSALNVSWSSGVLYSMSGEKYIISSGNKTFLSSQWNPGQPILSFLCYNHTSETMEAVQAPNIESNTDVTPIFGVVNNNYPEVYSMFYNPNLISTTLTDVTMNNKKMISELSLIGDSITTNNRWANYLDLNIGTISNYAVSGKRMSGTGGMYDLQRTQVNSTSDFCIIMGGTNDAANSVSFGGESAPIGVIGDGDMNTYLGAYSLLLDYLLTLNSEMQIVLMVPPQAFYTEYDPNDIRDNALIEPYREGTRQIAEHYGLPCIDLPKLMGWNEITNAAFSSDGLHPNIFGSKKMALIIDRFIRNYL